MEHDRKFFTLVTGVVLLLQHQKFKGQRSKSLGTKM